MMMLSAGDAAANMALLHRTCLIAQSNSTCTTVISAMPACAQCPDQCHPRLPACKLQIYSRGFPVVLRTLNHHWRGTATGQQDSWPHRCIFCCGAAAIYGERLARSTYPSSPHDLRCLTGLVISDNHFLRVSFGDEHGDKLFDSREEPVGAYFELMDTTLASGNGSTSSLEGDDAMANGSKQAMHVVALCDRISVPFSRTVNRMHHVINALTLPAFAMVQHISLIAMAA